MKQKLAILICSASLLTGVIASPASASSWQSNGDDSPSAQLGGHLHGGFSSMMRMCGGGC